MRYGVLTTDDLHSSTVPSIFRLASPRSSFTLPPLSYRAASALSLAKDLHYNIPITTYAVALALTRLSSILPSNIERHPCSDSSHDPFKPQLKVRVYPPLLYDA